MKILERRAYQSFLNVADVPRSAGKAGKGRRQREQNFAVSKKCVVIDEGNAFHRAQSYYVLLPSNFLSQLSKKYQEFFLAPT